MMLQRIRKTLGFGWFVLLVIATAGFVILIDADIEEMRSLLSLPYTLTIVLISLPLGLLVAPSFLLFRQRRWLFGICAAIATGGLFWLALQVLQTTASPTITVGEALLLLPRAAAVLGGWIMIVALPSALLLNR